MGYNQAMKNRTPDTLPCTCSSSEAYTDSLCPGCEEWHRTMAADSAMEDRAEREREPDPVFAQILRIMMPPH